MTHPEPEPEDPHTDFQVWELRMNEAMDQPCQHEAYSELCICPPCRLARMWEDAALLDRLVLYAGMDRAGFTWGGERKT